MFRFHKGSVAAVASAAAMLVLGGCASSGMGGGQIFQAGKPATPVMFSWKSNDGSIDGTMTATLPNATYQGRFFQITRQTQTDSLGPMWSGWAPGWSDWPYWGDMSAMPMTQFSTVYSGKVIANLTSPSGSRMRCRLHMAQPVSGMSGGGSGECQIAGGPTIQATF